MGAGTKSDPTHIQIADLTLSGLRPALVRALPPASSSCSPSTDIDDDPSAPFPLTSPASSAPILNPGAKSELAKGSVDELVASARLSRTHLDPLSVLLGLHIATYVCRESSQADRSNDPRLSLPLKTAVGDRSCRHMLRACDPRLCATAAFPISAAARGLHHDTRASSLPLPPPTPPCCLALQLRFFTNVLERWKLQRDAAQWLQVGWLSPDVDMRHQIVHTRFFIPSFLHLKYSLLNDAYTYVD
ncbi:hypothetical protein BGW80DRAFT_1559972 [Lactifluus volemus]|nr:hypothetical protein BGW80DRAFT_1559972 [Lactifluus volemus]